MMNVIPWFEVASVLSFVLVIVIAYDLIAVRSVRRKIAELEARADAFNGSIQAVAGSSGRAATTGRRIKEELRQLELRLAQVELRSNVRPYEQAIRLAARGERAEHLVSCFGLAEVEANLISLLHGDRNPHSSARQAVGGRPASAKEPVIAQNGS